MKCFYLALPILLTLESSVARPFGFPSSLRMPAFAKQAFLNDEVDTVSSTTATILPLRGGGAAEVIQEEDTHMPPRISAADMALALRWTGEINRRLDWGTRPKAESESTHGPLVASSLSLDASHHSHPTVMRGGGGVGEVTSTSTSRGAAHEVAAPLLTIFHAKSPRPTGNGAARWGPSLEAYVTHICHELNLSPEGSPELSLALIYLDRATSAETPRSHALVPAVPFLQPRTVHRLVLTALLLATHTTQGWPLPVLMERVQSLGIPAEQLSQMLQWMHGALGDPGYFVTLYSIQNWHRVLAETARLRNLLSREEEDEEEEEEEEKDEVATPTTEQEELETSQWSTSATETEDSTRIGETDVTADNHGPRVVGAEAA